MIAAPCALMLEREWGQKGIRGSLGGRSSWARLVCRLDAAVWAVRRSPGFVFNACSTSLKYNRLALYSSELRPLQVAHDDLTCGGLLSWVDALSKMWQVECGAEISELADGTSP